MSTVKESNQRVGWNLFFEKNKWECLFITEIRVSKVMNLRQFYVEVWKTIKKEKQRDLEPLGIVFKGLTLLCFQLYF